MSAVFNGATSYIGIPTGSYLNFGIQWTVSWFFKINGTGISQQHYFFHRSGIGLTGDNTISARFVESTNAFIPFYRDSLAVAASTSTTTGEFAGSGWYHAVMVRQRNRSDGTSVLTNYLNGVQLGVDDTHFCTGINFTTPLFLGRRGDTTTSVVLSGQMAEFAKFDRCLTKAEILQLYSGHDPQLLSNGKPSLYFPLRNDYADRIVGVTGIATVMSLSPDHPVPEKVYIQTNDTQNILPQLDGRVGSLEQRGFIDYIDWTPGGVPPSGISQTGAFFSSARLGDGYIASPNRSLSGCTVQAYASGGNNGVNSGTLQLIVMNLSPLPVDLSGQVRFNIYRL